ncbi:MAG: MerR family transcriptional regulator [Caldilineaceae bacterium]
MFKIGDFSKLGQVSTRMLRHYDQLGLLVPNEIDKWTGYRYYTIDQLPRLHRIIALKDLGLSLEQIGQLLADGDDLPVEQLRGMLTMRRVEIQRELQEQQMRLVEVDGAAAPDREPGQPSPYEVVVKAVAPQPLASVRQIVPHVAQMGFHCQRMTNYLYTQLKTLNVPPQEPEVTLYHEDEYKENDLDVEIGVAVDGGWVACPPQTQDVQFRELPESPLTAALIYEGSFESMTDGVLELLRWAGLHGHAPAGRCVSCISPARRTPRVDQRPNGL